jgi:acyl-CoA synthetase (AMP-forming)/AMP-acid ligase II
MDANSLPKNDANFAALTPLTFIQRAALAYGNQTSVVYENTKFSWMQTYDRCLRLAAWLQSVGIKKNDVVSICIVKYHLFNYYRIYICSIFATNYYIFWNYFCCKFYFNAQP